MSEPTPDSLDAKLRELGIDPPSEGAKCFMACGWRDSYVRSTVHAIFYHELQLNPEVPNLPDWAIDVFLVWPRPSAEHWAGGGWEVEAWSLLKNAGHDAQNAGADPLVARLAQRLEVAAWQTFCSEVMDAYKEVSRRPYVLNG